jgi:hypothetical protein
MLPCIVGEGNPSWGAGSVGGDDILINGEADRDDVAEVAVCDAGVDRVNFLISSFNVWIHS